MLTRRMVSSFRGDLLPRCKKVNKGGDSLGKKHLDFKNANSRGSFPGVKTSEKTEISI